MFSFLKKIEKENIPVVRAILNGTSAILSYAVLLWFLYLVSFSWPLILAAFVGVVFIVCLSMFEDKLITSLGESNTKKEIFICSFYNFFVFWSIVLYLFFCVHIGIFVILLAIISCGLSFVRLLMANILLPKLISVLKRTKDVSEEHRKDSSNINKSFLLLLEENKLLSCLLKKSLFYVLIPSFISIALLWWSFYYIIISLNMSVEMILFIIFVIIFQEVLSKFSEILKKELINKITQAGDE